MLSLGWSLPGVYRGSGWCGEAPGSLGAFTTSSTFTYETLALIEAGPRVQEAGIYGSFFALLAAIIATRFLG